MSKKLVAIATAAMIFTTAAHAELPSYLNPYAETSHGLRFADLEAAMPRNPRIWSADPRWEAHHTPARLLSPATDALRAAIPDGTPADTAAAVLHKAGAHCVPSGEAEIDCRYRTVETPFAGSDWDNVLWKVKLSIANGEIGGLAVSRDWTRR